MFLLIMIKIMGSGIWTALFIYPDSSFLTSGSLHCGSAGLMVLLGMQTTAVRTAAKPILGRKEEI